MSPANPHSLPVGARLARWVVGRPRTVLGLALLVVLAAAPGALRLRLGTDLTDLLPRRAPGVAAFARYTHAFASQQALVVLVESRDPQALLAFADDYAAALRRLPEVAEVRARLGKEAAALVRDHLLDLLDDRELALLAERTTPEALARQARRLRSLLAAPGGSALAPLLTSDPLELVPLVGERLRAGLPVDATTGYFRSADGQALLLFVHPRHGPFDIEADRRLLAAAGRAAEAAGGAVGEALPAEPPARPTVWFTGAYAYAIEYRDWLHHDLQISTLVSGLSVLLFFALLLGAVRVLPMVALPLGLGLWLTAAAAGLLFGQINAVSLAFATILLSIGIDVPIQLYNRLREEVSLQAAGEPGRAALERTVASLAGPSLIATLGPAVVFLACCASDYQGLAQLGLLAALGLVLNLLAMLTVLPALLAALPERWWLPRRRPQAEGAWFARLGRLGARHPRRVLFVAGLVGLAALPGALRVRYDEHLVTIEPRGMRAAAVTREVERRMGRRHEVLMALVEDGDRERALERSDRWRGAAEVLRRQGLVASYQSVSSLLPSPQEQLRRRAQRERLGAREMAARLRAALAEAGFDTAAFAPFLTQLESPPPLLQLAEAPRDLRFLIDSHVSDQDQARLVVTFLFPTPGRSAEARRALAALAGAAETRAELTGAPLLDEALHAILGRDTWRITILSLAAVALVLGLYYRRARPLLAVLLPLTIAWLLFAAALGAAGIPLNLFNLLTVPLVIGYGIDDHVFLVHRYREQRYGPPERALASTGRAIVVTSLSTMAGFVGLVPAKMEGLRLLGWSGGLAVALCLLAALAILPALLVLLWPPSPAADPPDARATCQPPQGTTE